MGMLATIQNGLFLAEILKQQGMAHAYLFTNLPVESISERFSYKRAESHLERGGIVLIGGGLGKPGFTTDTAVVAQAFELGCETVVKTTKVDGVYNKDPEQFKDATKYAKLSFKEALSNEGVQVMDRAALALAADKNIKIAISQPDPDKVLTLLGGDTSFGTLVGF
jgi:uridylate kinase